MRNPARAISIVMAGVLALASCAPLDRTSGNRAATGAAVGAAGGATLGVLGGGGVVGNTVRGAAAGAVGGLVYDQIKKN